MVRAILAAMGAIFLAACSSTPKITDQLPDVKLVLPPVSFQGDVFVDFKSHSYDHPKVAVMPFKAAVELAGSSCSEVFATELLKTARYELIERGQIENVFKEQELQLSGVSEDQLAAKVGKLLGVNAVVVGTVSEYGFQRVRLSKAPSIGLTVRLIDCRNGKVVWSVSHNSIGDSRQSLSQHAAKMIEEMVAGLSRAWVEAGDVFASGLPPPAAAQAAGGVREVVLSWTPHTSIHIAGYEVRRQDPGGKTSRTVARLRNTREPRMHYTDSGLMDLTAYPYEVRTISKFGLISTDAARLEAITFGPPAPPAGLQAKGGIRKVTVTWQKPDDTAVTGYRVQSRAHTGNFMDIGVVRADSGCTFVDSTRSGSALTDSTPYVYRVIAINRVGLESDPSAPVTGMTCPPPSRVLKVTARSGMPKSVALDWTGNPPEEEVASYIVQRGEQAEGPFSDVARVPVAKGFVYTDGGPSSPLATGKTYWYRVAACNGAYSQGEPSVAVPATTKPAPPAPTSVQASSSRPRQIVLTWKKPAETVAAAYTVHRTTSPSGRTTRIGTVQAPATAYEDRNLSDGAIYWYAVTLTDLDGLESAPGPLVQGVTKKVPNPPTDIRATSQKSEVTLKWSASPSADVQRYMVYVDGFLGTHKVGESADTTCTVSGLKIGKGYRFTVRTVDRDGLMSSDSAPVHCVVK